MDLGQGCWLLMPGVDRELEEGARSHGVPPPPPPLIQQTELNGGEGGSTSMARAEEARAGYDTAGDHWGVAASSLVRAQGAVHAGEISTVATMTAEILRQSEASGYDALWFPRCCWRPGSLSGERTWCRGGRRPARPRARGANRLCRPRLLRPGPTRLERARARGDAPSRGALSAGAGHGRGGLHVTPRRTCARAARPRPGGGRRCGYRRDAVPGRCRVVADAAAAPRPTRCKGRLWRPDRCAGAGSPGGPTVASGVEFQEKLPDQSSRGVSGCRSSGPRRGPRDRDPRHGSAASLRRVAAASNPAHARRALAVSPGHGSRVAAALASLARKRRLADRARGDV
jgi:hypothetical protein